MSRYRVKAAKTACPGIVVHEAWGIDKRGTDYKRWSVTHVASGVAVAHARSYDAARKIAAVLATFPIDWRQGQAPKNYGDAREMARRIIDLTPLEFRAWLTLVNTDGGL
jgi:hypothetical protein